MYLPWVFHGKVCDTKEVYCLGLGIESLSESPTTVTMWRRSLCNHRGWRAGDAGGGCSRFPPLLGGGEEECLPLVMRVGAYADELRLMGGERGSSLFRVVGADK